MTSDRCRQPAGMARQSHEHSRVLVAHPGTQHSRATARALRRKGLLLAFATGYAIDTTRLPFALITYLPKPARERVLARLGRRLANANDLGPVLAPPLWPLLLNMSGRLGRTPRWRTRVGHLEDAAFDRWLCDELVKTQPAAVHCFEASCLRTLTRARQQGVKAVLDVASDHTAYVRVLQEEGERLSRTAPRQQNPYGHIHTRPTIYAERATADFLLVPAEHVRQGLLADGVPSSKIHVIPYGVDTSFFAPQPQARRADQPFTAVFVGTVSHRKGIHHLVQAWQTLKLRRARLIIVGALDTAMDSLRMRAGDDIVWAGNVPRARVREYLQQADAFVFPSQMEGSALVVYEAMACGLPVITTPTAGSVVRDGVDGFIVPPSNAEALKERLYELYCHPDLRRHMGESGRAYVDEHYTWEHYGDRLAQFYCQVVFAGVHT